jgi:trigger factor
MDTYLRYIGKTEEEFLDELRPNANERLTRYLVMRKLSQEEDISASDDEVQEEIETAIASAGDSSEQMRRTLSSEVAKENVRSSILNRKVMQRLVEIARGSEETEDASHALETEEAQPTDEADELTTVESEEQPEASAPANNEESNGGA